MITFAKVILNDLFQSVMKRLFLVLSVLFFLFSVVPFQSCTKDDIEKEEEPEFKDPKQEEREKIVATNRFYMKKYYEEYFPYYFWYDDVIQKVDKLKFENFSTINEYFKATLFSGDRWSWMMTADEYLSSEAGEQTGTYGVSLGQAIKFYGDYSIKVRFIYPGSPFEKFGVTRGWTLTHMDSVPVMDYVASGKFNKALYKENQLFTFKDLKGEPHTFNASPLSTLSTRPGLKAQVFEPGDYPGLTEPVGYFLYMSFKANFLEDIDNAFALFKEAGVKKVILDLRYNGGGDSRAEKLLVSYLAPQSADGQVFKRIIHNKLLTQYNSIDTIARKDNSLDLDQLYVIGGEGTASASEVTINGLKPFMDLYLVGDTTYGKPNGMYVLYYPGTDEDYARYDNDDFSTLKLVFLPIAFFSKNGRSESIPYNGFVPDCLCPDDLNHDFGVEENNIKACLEHIVNGSFPSMFGTSPRIQTRTSVPEAGSRIPDDLMASPLYGKTLLPAPKELRK